MRKMDFGQIIAGSLKGRKIRFSAARGLRPTRRIVRESIFSAVFSQMGSLEGLTVLDAFCGSGLLGLEFLSRGAAFVDFVDRSTKNYHAFRDNIAPFVDEIADRFKYWNGTVGWVMTRAHSNPKWDIVWFDPPFEMFPDADISAALAGGLCRLFGIHVSNHKSAAYMEFLKAFEKNYSRVFVRSFGESTIIMMKLNEA